MIIYMLYTIDPTHTLATFLRLAKSRTLQKNNLDYGPTSTTIISDREETTRTKYMFNCAKEEKGSKSTGCLHTNI
jgi:hypothetical protein